MPSEGNDITERRKLIEDYEDSMKAESSSKRKNKTGNQEIFKIKYLESARYSNC